MVTEDQCIHHAQHLDLIYSQSGMLYYLLPNAPGNLNSLTTQKPGAHADSLIGMVSGIVTQPPRG